MCAVKHILLKALHDCTAASRRFAAGTVMHARGDRDALAEHERFVSVLVRTCTAYATCKTCTACTACCSTVQVSGWRSMQQSKLLKLVFCLGPCTGKYPWQ
jgi:hypothetical protein